MRRLLLLLTALPVAATAQPVALPARMLPAIVTHVGRDGVGGGVVLPLGAEAIARITASGDPERGMGGPEVCPLDVFGGCGPVSDIRTRRGALTTALLVRGTGLVGIRPYVGADVAMRVEWQAETVTPGRLSIDGAPLTSTRMRLAARPGLVGGLDVSLTPRLGLYAEGSASAPAFGFGPDDWRTVERYTPFRADAGLRVAW